MKIKELKAKKDVNNRLMKSISEDYKEVSLTLKERSKQPNITNDERQFLNKTGIQMKYKFLEQQIKYIDEMLTLAKQSKAENDLNGSGMFNYIKKSGVDIYIKRQEDKKLKFMTKLTRMDERMARFHQNA